MLQPVAKGFLSAALGSVSSEAGGHDLPGGWRGAARFCAWLHEISPTGFGSDLGRCGRLNNTVRFFAGGDCVFLGFATARLLLAAFKLGLEVFNVLRADLHKEDAVDYVEHLENIALRRRLNLDGWQCGRGVLLVDVVDLLLQHHGLLRQVAQALRALPRLVVLLAELCLVDGVGLLLVVQGTAEVSQARLRPGHQVVAHRHLQAAAAIELYVELKGILEEPKGQVILPNGVKYETNVAIQDGHLWVQLPADEEHEVACPVQQLECRGHLRVGKAVQCQVGIFGDGVRMVDAIHPFTHEHCFLLVSHCLHVVPHDVVESGEQAQALGNLRVHGPVHVVHEVEGLADELVALPEQALLDLALARQVEAVGIRGPGMHVLGHGEHVHHVLLGEGRPRALLQGVVPMQQLQAALEAQRAQQHALVHPKGLQKVLGAPRRHVGARGELPAVVGVQLPAQLLPQRPGAQRRPLCVV
uniref:Uncharacterized protein n=1 Tax=Ixodes ricinus TaxID=34613 RepID=A0A6B0VBG7_IXORI